MGNFDYRKWVTENKYGKINEQNITGSEGMSITGSEVYVGCGQCNADSQAPGEFACMPGVEITVSLNQIEPNIVNTYSAQFLSNNEVIGGFEAIGYGGTLLLGPQAAQYLEYNCPSGSSENIDQGNYEPFCCDINAMNFGQTANGEPYGINPGEPEQYLMQNGPQGDMCDNSICQGSIGGDSFNDTIDPNAPQGMNLAPNKMKPGMKPKPGIKPAMDPKKQALNKQPRRLREIKDIIEKSINQRKINENKQLLKEEQHSCNGYDHCRQSCYSHCGVCNNCCHTHNMEGTNNWWNECSYPIDSSGNYTNTAVQKPDRGTPTNPNSMHNKANLAKSMVRGDRGKRLREVKKAIIKKLKEIKGKRKY